jgi:DNA gyrase subunit A
MADAVLIVTTKGHGKVVMPDDFKQQKRGGKGVIGFKVTMDSGPVAATEHVVTGAGERVLITTAQGQSIMTPVDDISMRSRTAGGVKLMDVADGDRVVSVII